jgi:hypothetical protein
MKEYKKKGTHAWENIKIKDRLENIQKNEKNNLNKKYSRNTTLLET